MVAFSPAAFDAFLSQEDGAAIVMVNLLRFEPDGGRQRYRRYLEMAEPILARFGARILFEGVGLPVFTAGSQRSWDAVVLVRYPSRAAFGRMVADPDYRIAFELGRSAIAEIHLQPVTERGVDP